MICTIIPLTTGTAFAATHELQAVSVRPGDTLWGIAQMYLKDPTRWDEILKFNPQLSSDVTVALPGMTLQIPIRLIKKDLLAARLIEKINKVLFRRKETAKWGKASKNMQLYRDDWIKTRDKSSARVRFLNTDLLSLPPNSMAVLKPLNKDYAVELKSAGTYLGRAKILTATAKIEPQTKDAKYLAIVGKDLSTEVKVSKGVVSVAAGGKTVEVKEGMQTMVKLGKGPSVPGAIPNLPAFRAQVAKLSTPGASMVRAKLTMGTTKSPKAGAAKGLLSEMENLTVGEPVSGYRIQVSRSRDFSKVIANRVVDVEEKNPASRLGLASGRYWVRVATIDLLGSQGKFGAPARYLLKGGKMIKSSSAR